MRLLLPSIFTFALALSAGGALAAGCGGNKGTGGTNTGGTGGTSSGSTSSVTSSGFGHDGGVTCLSVGSACNGPADCCTGACNSTHVCTLPPCLGDGTACTSDGTCCSGNCSADGGTGGTCTPLNTTCKTLNNACTASSECCSGLCASGSCSPSSWCIQTGDVCSNGTECCGGVCNKSSAGALYGTCGQPPTGSANCGSPDGTLCAGGATLGDGGLPACGGACCSRLCAPWGPSQVLVCQPASGCHPVGDLCTVDADCCGSAGLPGGSGTPVTCTIAPGDTIGICRNPQGCKPNGDVCKLATMSCNASCDCCAGNCENEDTCKTDSVGVPRCTGVSCVDGGAACASSADCCNGLPCVPSPSGSPPYVCGAGPCVPTCGKCTINADCCPGETCITPVGSAMGTCGPCLPDAGTSSSSSTSSGTTSSSTSSSTGGPPCGLYGQECSTTSPCCNGIPCTNNMNAPCTSGQTGCTCVIPVK